MKNFLKEIEQKIKLSRKPINLLKKLKKRETGQERVQDLKAEIKAIQKT